MPSSLCVCLYTCCVQKISTTASNAPNQKKRSREWNAAIYRFVYFFHRLLLIAQRLTTGIVYRPIDDALKWMCQISKFENNGSKQHNNNNNHYFVCSKRKTLETHVTCYTIDIQVKCIIGNRTHANESTIAFFNRIYNSLVLFEGTNRTWYHMRAGKGGWSKKVRLGHDTKQNGIKNRMRLSINTIKRFLWAIN